MLRKRPWLLLLLALALRLLAQGWDAGSSSSTLHPDERQIAFVQTGGLLEPDTYTVTLFSGATRFRDTAGGALDGNADGVGASFVKRVEAVRGGQGPRGGRRIGVDPGRPQSRERGRDMRRRAMEACAGGCWQHDADHNLR